MDATVTIVYYIGHILSHIVSHRPEAPTTLARGEAINLSIQFVLFWMPFFVLLADKLGERHGHGDVLHHDHKQRKKKVLYNGLSF